MGETRKEALTLGFDGSIRLEFRGQPSAATRCCSCIVMSMTPRITDFSFINTGLLYGKLTYTYTNADLDGSRARFMGVILDGQATAAVPEPATASLGMIALGGLMMRRRRMS